MKSDPTGVKFSLYYGVCDNLTHTFTLHPDRFLSPADWVVKYTEFSPEETHIIGSIGAVIGAFEWGNYKGGAIPPLYSIVPAEIELLLSLDRKKFKSLTKKHSASFIWKQNSTNCYHIISHREQFMPKKRDNVNAARRHIIIPENDTVTLGLYLIYTQKLNSLERGAKQHLSGRNSEVTRTIFNYLNNNLMPLCRYSCSRFAELNPDYATWIEPQTQRKTR